MNELFDNMTTRLEHTETVILKIVEAIKDLERDIIKNKNDLRELKNEKQQCGCKG